jgi:uncharacterized protein YbjQ (UPF0145 family)
MPVHRARAPRSSPPTRATASEHPGVRRRRRPPHPSTTQRFADCDSTDRLGYSPHVRIVSAPLVYLSVEGEAQGPFTAAELSELWKAGEIDATALYWFRGMVGWLPVERYAAPTTVTVPPERVALTTLPGVANRPIESEIEIVSAEVVLTKDLIGDLAVGLRDLVGGRSATLQHSLRQARTTCLDELRSEAARLGADGVVGVALTYSPVFTGAASVMLVATGTAVALGPPPLR